MNPQEYCLFWMDWWPICMDKAQWASWVQAIGSIAAIVSAALIVWWQQRMGQKSALCDRHRDELAKAKALEGALRAADAMLTSTHRAADSLPNFIAFADDVLDNTMPSLPTMLEALERMPLDYATTPDLLLRFIEARNSCAAGTSIIESMRYSVRTNDQARLEIQRAHLARHLPVLHSAFRAFKARADALTEEIKGLE